VRISIGLNDDFGIFFTEYPKGDTSPPIEKVVSGDDDI